MANSQPAYQVKRWESGRLWAVWHPERLLPFKFLALALCVTPHGTLRRIFFPSMIDNPLPDWGRERLAPGEWSPGKRLLACIRDYQRYQRQKPLLSGLWAAWAVLRHRWWSAVSGADIPLNCQIGGGLMLPHPNGVVIHPDARIGPNCLIFQQVTLGTLAAGGTPTVGGHVDIGAGAKLLGGITVGDHTQIGANAVVLTDVPSFTVAVGAPARCFPTKRKSPSHA